MENDVSEEIKAYEGLDWDHMTSRISMEEKMRTTCSFKYDSGKRNQNQ